MNNNIIGIVVGVIVTLLLALYAGTSTAEGSDTPLIIIGVVIFLIVMLSLKDKVWALLVISTMTIVTLPGPLAKFQAFQVILFAVIPFYIFNVFFRRTDLTWNKNKPCDFFVLLIAIIIASLLIRFPAGVLIVEGADYVNSRAYFDFILAFLFYILLSTVKTKFSVLSNVMVVTAYASLAAAIYGLATSRLGLEAQNLNEDRIVAFSALGTWLVLFCMVRYSIWGMLKKPWIMFFVLVGLAGVTLSGFRNQLGRLGLIFFSVSFIYRRYLDIIAAPLICAVGLVLVALTVGATKLPAGIQRSISFLPIEVRKDIRGGAEDSSEWRYDMWKWAMDEKENYIKDRIWGDGFAQEKEEFTRLNMQAAMDSDNRREYAARGLWHSGPISTIHRMGIVGLVVVVFFLISMAYCAFIVCRIYYVQKKGWAIVMYAAPITIAPIQWLFVVGDIANLYNYIIAIPVLKLLLSTAQRENLYIPAYKQKEYIPMMIQQTEKDRINQFS